MGETGCPAFSYVGEATDARQIPRGRSCFRPSQSVLRRHWKWAVCHLQLSSKDYQPYGPRRGDTCEDWAHFQDAGRLVWLGRWESLKTAKIYAVEALHIRDARQLSEEQNATMAFWADRFATYLQGI